MYSVVFLVFNLMLIAHGAPTEKWPSPKSDVTRSDPLYYLRLFLSELDDRYAPRKSERYCQTGFVGCVGNCGGYDVKGTDQYVYKTYGVKFAEPFSRTPTVTLALKRITQRTPDFLEDLYGWNAEAKDVSSSGFTAKITLYDRKISTFQASWIACA